MHPWHTTIQSINHQLNHPRPLITTNHTINPLVAKIGPQVCAPDDARGGQRFALARAAARRFVAVVMVLLRVRKSGRH